MFKNYLYKKRQNSSTTAIKLSNLQRVLLLFVIGPLLLLTALVLHLVLQQANDFQQQRLKNDLELVGRAISIPVGNALNQKDVEAVNIALDSVFAISEVYGASVFDIDGKLIAAAGVSANDLRHSKIPNRIKETGEGEEQFSRIQGRRLFSHFLPLFDSQEQIQGLIQISRKASDFEYSLKKLTKVTWLLWLVLSSLIVTAVLVGHYGAIGRYVEKLLSSMKKVADGDLSHRFAIRGPNELAVLTQGLNHMLDSITAAHQQIKTQQLAQQKLISQLKEQEKVVEIGRMSQGIAHELGAPLSVIDGRARKLMQLSQDEGVQKQSQVIRQQIKRLTSIIHQLLDYSRPDLRAKESIDISSYLLALKDEMATEFEQAQCQFQLIDQSQKALLVGDKQRLHLVFTNLLRNALQAESQLIQLTAQQDKEKLIITIADDGVGLAEYTVEELTQAFFTTKLPGQGTGLGLAIVKAVMQEFGGEFYLFSRAPQGCEARLEFKL